MELIHSMVSQVVAFAEENISLEATLPHDLAEAMAKAGDFFQNYCTLRDELNPTLWRSVVGWFKRAEPDHAQRREQLQRLLVNGVDVMGAYFQICCNSLSDASSNRSCSEACAVFLADINQLVAWQP